LAYRDAPEVTSLISEGDVPVKYSYLAEAAQDYDEWARSERYRRLAWALENEAAIVGEALRGVESFQLCDIGPGNGCHAVSLFSRGKIGSARLGRYLAMDLSEPLLQVTLATVHQAWPDVEVEATQWDIECEPTSHVSTWREEEPARLPVVLALLGLTLGNVVDPARVLRNIRESCLPGDLLVVGIGIQDRAWGSKESLASYTSEEFRRGEMTRFERLGISRDDVVFDVWFEDDTVLAGITARRTLRLDGAVVVPAGKRITCFRSRRFREDKVEELLAGSGWVQVAMRINHIGVATILVRAA
jgi:L-histidine Nalpha-methyltransferase